VYGGVDPTNQSSFLTTSSEKAAELTRQGYTYKELLGPSFLASETPGEGLVEVHRLYRKKNRDYQWSADPHEIETQVHDFGYDDQGIRSTSRRHLRTAWCPSTGTCSVASTGSSSVTRTST